jgi:hypothetical protein
MAPRRQRLRLITFLALLVLVAGHALAVLHGYSHQSREAGGDVRALHAAVDGHSLAHWFDSHEEGTGDCRVVDQLAAGGPLATPPGLEPASLPSALAGTAIQRAPSGARDIPFEARGPPFPRLA